MYKKSTTFFKRTCAFITSLHLSHVVGNTSFCHDMDFLLLSVMLHIWDGREVSLVFMNKISMLKQMHMTHNVVYMVVPDSHHNT